MDWANQILATHGIKVRGLSIQENGDGTGKITIAGRATTPGNLEQAAKEIAQHKAVTAVDWEFQ